MNREVKIWSYRLEQLEAVERAAQESARRLQHLRNELSGRLSGDAATKFFGVTDTTISMIEDALSTSTK
jgi:hypothetical protein